MTSLFDALDDLTASGSATLDKFRGKRMNTAELLSVMGSAAETDRRKARMKAAGMTESEIAEKLLEDAQERLKGLENGAIVPMRNHGDKALLIE
ncbi:hypothetical protein [Shewanella algae]|uniref:hypothetical protein n=1 Tax=Shewanella algae TaxID=38313 RepID=UPI003AAEEBDF